MSEVLKSLIPVAAALIGGVIGFIGAIVASARTTRANIEHARISQLRDRQYDVFGTLYGLVSAAESIAAAGLVHSKTDKELSDQSAALGNAVIDIHTYILANRLWLPNDVALSAGKFGSSLFNQHLRFVKTSDNLRSVNDPEYPDEKERFERWVHNECDDLTADVYRIMSNHLELGDLRRRKDTMPKPASYTTYLEYW